MFGSCSYGNGEVNSHRHVWKKRFRTTMAAAAVVLGALLALPAQAEDISVRSRDLEVELREDLNGFAAVTDRRTGRNYAGDAAAGLYELWLGRTPQDAVRIDSLKADERSVETTKAGLEIHYVHREPVKLQVVCRAVASPDERGVRWSIEVANGSDRPLVLVEFPRLACTSQLGDASGDDGIVAPCHEGVLLADPKRNMKADGIGAWLGYPGGISMQMLYYFDPAGGLYVAAHDSAGNPKRPVVRRDGEVIRLGWQHERPSVHEPKTAIPYEVIWAAAGGTWQHGADVYRDWVQRQPWCTKKVRERDTPEWLLDANIFLNFSANEEAFRTSTKAADAFKTYREFFGLPVVATAFSWEGNGSWISPEYFPPTNGEQYYKDLARALAEHDSHLHVYTSGFRWGVRKPVKAGPPRVYNDYDSTERFKARAEGIATVAPDGGFKLQQRPWADNYHLCAGSAEARELIRACYRRVFSWGVAGMDHDQDIGAEVYNCYTDSHSHPPGAGIWQHRAMAGFLAQIRADARAVSADTFLGVEEPCELYIPQFDIFHGRAFTSSKWPARGAGGVSIPLYAYVYHEHQLGYAGWIDRGFCPMMDVDIGLGRAFIFGMQLGVRIVAGRNPHRMAGEPTPELLRVRDAARLQTRVADCLLHGRMLHDPIVVCEEKFPAGTPGGYQAKPLPIDWPVVQATAWQSAVDGSVCYALANLSEKPQTIQLEVLPHGMRGPVTLTAVRADGEEELAEQASLPRRLALKLQSREICCIRQRAGKR